MIGRETLERCENRQSEFRSKTAEKFTKSEQSALNVDSKEAFEIFWKGALSNKRGFDVKREHGRRRAGKKVTSLSSSAYDIIQNFGSLVNIIKDFGAPFGGMAIGTICFLLTIAKNRTKMEIQINDTLLQIRDRLPGVKMYQQIYDDDTELGQHLQSKIVDAYDSFILFCVEASEFYSMRAINRWINSFGNNTDLDDKAMSVQNAIVDVRRVSEELLNRTVTEVKRINLELLEGRDQERLEKIRVDLRLEVYSPEAHQARLKRHKSDLEAEFGSHYEFESPLYKIVENDAKFQAWRSSKTSRLLLLSGRNSVYDAPHCWVSPVAIDMIKFLTDPASKKDSDFCVFYMFGLCDEDEPFTHVLAFFIHQLLYQNKRSLNHKNLFEELNADLNAYVQDTAGKESRGPEGHLQAILLRVINSFEMGQTIWCILDRVDKCRTSDEKKLWRHRRALLKVLSHVVARTTSRLMVLAVINTRDWDVENFVSEIQGEQSREKVTLLTYDEDEALYQS
ncbi:hypothetical protein HYFRA_00013109 [Hymenoscyphus fraxineus]|uniref:Uncharacterized protein n=1 Tax=Hymenoscyphus fraxineus TaxID=746836 RepID=A0A9N9L4J2_9HELO|nr:hypothetical protein HYFRA_00013109 [Hymenoscyphus fraxineus]